MTRKRHTAPGHNEGIGFIMVDSPQTTVLAASSTATLIALGAELAACDALKSNCPEKDDEQYAALDLQHWDLREKINRIPAATLEGLRVKARAAEFAIKQDIDVTCEGDGSFVDLCRSINQDIFSMDGA
jgi:hypothetical protein